MANIDKWQGYTDHAPPIRSGARLTTDTTEPRNLTETTGQVVDDADLFQMSKAVADYAAVSTFYEDSGSASTYVLSSIGNFEAPHAYTNGMEVRFRAANASSGASTVNVAGLGVVNIKQKDGTSDLLSGQIPTTKDTKLRHNGTNFLLEELDEGTTSLKGINYLSPDWGYGFVPKSNTGTPDTNVDITAGKIVAKDGKTILNLDSDASNLNLETLLGGALAVDTTYHLMRYLKSDDTFQWYISTNVAPTIGDIKSANAYRRILSIYTDSSGDIREFHTFHIDTIGLLYLYKDRPIQQFSGTLTSSENVIALTIPGGLKLKCNLSSYITGINDVTRSVRFYSFDENDSVVGSGNSQLLEKEAADGIDGGSGYATNIVSSTSRQIKYRSSADVSGGFNLDSFIDNRLI